MKTLPCIFMIGMMLLPCGPILAANENSDGGPALNVDPISGNPIFSFKPPGARSLGMGATFIAIADDATAAESNPAGLSILTKPEFSINVSSTRRHHQSVNPFSEILSSDFSEFEFNEVISYTTSTSAPSFVSFVYPIKSRNLVLSMHYNRSSDFSNRERFLRGVEEVQYMFDFRLENFGLSAATRIGDKVAIGLSIKYSMGDLSTRTQYFLRGENEEVFFQDEFDETDRDLSLNLGVLINPGGKLSAGIVYKKGIDFTFDGLFDVVVFENDSPPTVARDICISSSLRVPSALGIGLAYRPSPQWVLGLDAVKVQYSETVSRFGAEGSHPDDATEIHLGLEYGFTLGKNNTPVFVRSGFYTDPDHDDTNLIDSEREFVTFGAGIFLKNKFQLDAAIAVADENTETLISMVWRL